MIKQLIAFFLVLAIDARAGKTPANRDLSDPLPAGKVIDSVLCKADPAQSYALYIPVKGNKKALPVIYFFDSHAAGALPLHKYKSLADAFGFILIGSNNSKNGNDWSLTETIWNQLSGDSRNRLHIDPNRIYTGGFSGGAKVASYVALRHPGIRGVIAGGAGLPDGTQAADFDFSFTAIAGEGDMNRTDLIELNSQLDKTRTRHRILSFDGIHEWAPESTMRIAFAGLQLDAILAGLIPRDTVFISQYSTASKKRVDVYCKTNQLIKAEEECRLSVNLLDGLGRESDWFRNKAASLVANPLYEPQRKEQETLLVTEQNKKEEYRSHFPQADKAYWVKTIAGLQLLAKGKTKAGGMHQRLLAYLSLAFYSFSNQLINGHENKGARYFVELYKLADPTNPEAWYFSAILDAREGLAPAAEKDLAHAVTHGFRDRGRLAQQPEFKNFASRIEIP